MKMKKKYEEMKTLVELWIDQKVTSKTVKEVLELSKYNTAKLGTIEINKDELDDKLLIVKFESKKGKQIDLADEIIKSYSDFLEGYSDISVYFETRRKKVSLLEKRLISKKEVVKLPTDFLKSLDKQDWRLLSECLDKKIEIIPKESSGGRIKGVNLNRYVDQRKKILSDLKTKHKIGDFITSRRNGGIKCHCKFEMEGVNIKSQEKFRSRGTIDFTIRLINDGLKIRGIRQEIEEIEGNKNIYKECIN